MKILAIVPARGGSKGIPNKNMIDVCGKPLIAYSIEQGCELKQQGLIDRVIVSTDSKDIANVSKGYGADVPFLRPPAISNDTSKSYEFCLHAIEYFEAQGEFYDAILLLQPTSPLRSKGLLTESVGKFSRNDAESLISVYKEEYINDLVMYTEADSDYLKPVNDLHNKGVRRQEHGGIFIRNGAVYLTKVDYVKKTKQLISDAPLFIEMKKNDSINLDTMEDLDLLRSKLCK